MWSETVSSFPILTPVDKNRKISSPDCFPISKKVQKNRYFWKRRNNPWKNKAKRNNMRKPLELFLLTVYNRQVWSPLLDISSLFLWDLSKIIDLPAISEDKRQGWPLLLDISSLFLWDLSKFIKKIGITYWVIRKWSWVDIIQKLLWKASCIL